MATLGIISWIHFLHIQIWMISSENVHKSFNAISHYLLVSLFEVELGTAYWNNSLFPHSLWYCISDIAHLRYNP